LWKLAAEPKSNHLEKPGCPVLALTVRTYKTNRKNNLITVKLRLM